MSQSEARAAVELMMVVKDRMDCGRNSIKRESSSKAPLMACVSAFELRLRLACERHPSVSGVRGTTEATTSPELVAYG
jgi:hypothetical protein